MKKKFYLAPFIFVVLTILFSQCSNLNNVDYAIYADAPVFSLDQGQYFGAQTVTMTSATEGAYIRYTLDGTDPTKNEGTLYEAAVTIDQNSTLKAVTYKSGYTISRVATAQYSIIIWKGTLATAPANPEGGWAYYNSTEGISYIYDGTAWQILAKDGADGADGQTSTANNNLVTINVTQSGSLINSLYDQTSANIKITTAEGVTLNQSDVDQITRYAHVTKDLSIDIKDAKIGAGINLDFVMCYSLKSISLPNSLTSIADNAFYNCSSLTSVVIPNSVTSIGGFAFYFCTGLTSVVIPDSVTSINKGAFPRCSGLTSITVSVDNPNYKSIDGVLFNKDGSSIIAYPGGKSGVYTIPSSVISIGDYAFFGCSGLTSVVIPNSVTSIGSESFRYCTVLTSIVIPNGVTSIEMMAFSDCTGLTSVTINAVIPPSLSHNIFYNTNTALQIKVPAASQDAYKAATFWNLYADKIVSQ